MGKARKALTVLAALLALAAAGVGAAGAQERLPIFDGHLHYNAEAWGAVPPAEVVRAMDAAGVRWALVSSTPDDGTVRLTAHAPDRFVPELRPYRGAVGAGQWMHDPELVAYLTERLAARRYHGIGEVHIFGDETARTGPANQTAALAAARKIPLHLHSGAGPVEILLAAHPTLHILWAHAGMSEPAATVRAMLDRHDRLCAELSYRARDIAPDGRIDPEWRDLFLRHPDRFVLGSDTWINEQWWHYGELIEAHRAWLALLPPEVAERIAWRNGVAMFGLEAGKP